MPPAGFQNYVHQLRQDIVQFEEQVVEDEVHVMDLKKQILRIVASYRLICTYCGSIIDQLKHAVALYAFISNHPVSFQNDIHQLRQNIMYLEKQALEEEVPNLHQQSLEHEAEEETSKDEVCNMEVRF